MNWKMTRPNHRVVFEAGEPVAMISPVRRGELERFSAETRMLSQDPELLTKYTEWSASRSKFNADLKTVDSDARETGLAKGLRARPLGAGGASTGTSDQRRADPVQGPPPRRVTGRIVTGRTNTDRPMRLTVRPAGRRVITTPRNVVPRMNLNRQ